MADKERIDRAPVLGRVEENPEARETYSVTQIRKAFDKHAGTDDWGLPAFYVGGLVAALRGEYDAPSSAPSSALDGDQGSGLLDEDGGA